MTHKLKILHISDAHFRSANVVLADAAKTAQRIDQVNREAWERERVLGVSWQSNIKNLIDSGDRPDIIVFTGDLADWGLPQEYTRATEFFSELERLTGIERKRVFVIPGNHDVCRGVREDDFRQLRVISSSLQRETSEWLAGGAAPYGVKDEWKTAIKERFQNFWKWVECDFGRPELLPSNSPHGVLGYQAQITIEKFPFQINLIGLETQWLSGDDHDAGKIWLSDSQIGILGTINGKPLSGLRIALGHHPLAILKDAEVSHRLVSDYFDIYLHGHQHSPLATIRQNPDRRLLELAAGCLFEGDDKSKYRNAFQCIDLSLDDHGKIIEVDIRFRAWSTGGFWHDDGAIYKSAVNGRLQIDCRVTASTFNEIGKMASTEVSAIIDCEIDSLMFPIGGRIDYIVNDCDGLDILISRLAQNLDTRIELNVLNSALRIDDPPAPLRKEDVAEAMADVFPKNQARLETNIASCIKYFRQNFGDSTNFNAARAITTCIRTLAKRPTVVSEEFDIIDVFRISGENAYFKAQVPISIVDKIRQRNGTGPVIYAYHGIPLFGMGAAAVVAYVLPWFVIYQQFEPEKLNDFDWLEWNWGSA
ncbi:metallophosphoesterase [Variovorax sp. J31P207]|uniref:metallophosphoesterase family protein n=1 Tax=Variovorax sp. J31P207 TaxID=3053510 RepID=UPI002574D435|nr:metallophosphoesterase [Variovorax sp. J31P207]MDM0071652.1 metallophosphoesterase [Variovorax sp. J31P207]